MDFRDPRNQIRFIFIVALCIIIFIWGKNVFFRNIQEIKSKNSQQENLNKQLLAFQAKKQTIEGLRQESEAREREYKSLELLLPEERQIPLFLTQMHGAAQATHTEIVQITPLGAAPVSFYNIDNFNIEVVSNYHGFGEFLSNIANFPFIANASNISMTGLSADEQEKRGISIRVSFKLSTYYIKEGEKLK
jgi:type IV pilus assembly protein PilO